MYNQFTYYNPTAIISYASVIPKLEYDICLTTRDLSQYVGRARQNDILIIYIPTHLGLSIGSQIKYDLSNHTPYAYEALIRLAFEWWINTWRIALSYERHFEICVVFAVVRTFYFGTCTTNLHTTKLKTVISYLSLNSKLEYVFFPSTRDLGQYAEIVRTKSTLSTYQFT